MTTCPVCGSQGKLKSNSHTIPKWMLKVARDSNGRMVKIDLTKLEENLQAQDGDKGDIICSDCEEKTSFDDNYVCRILTQQDSAEYKEIIRKSYNESDNLVFDVWSKVRFEPLKRFVIGIVLKAILFENKNKERHINLEKSEFFKGLVKNFLTPTDEDINFYMTRTPFYDDVAYPAPVSEAKNIWSFLGAGYKFVVYLRGHCDLEENSENIVSSKKDGSIFIMHEDEKSAQWFQKLRGKICGI